MSTNGCCGSVPHAQGCPNAHWLAGEAELIQMEREIEAAIRQVAGGHVAGDWKDDEIDNIMEQIASFAGMYADCEVAAEAQERAIALLRRAAEPPSVEAVASALLDSDEGEGARTVNRSRPSVGGTPE